MKTRIIAFGIVLLFGRSSFAQSRIGTGESWSYQFNSLPSLGTEVVVLGANSIGGAHVTLSSLAPGTHYTFSIYENSLSEAPIWVTDSMINQSASAGGVGIWQDLQGWAKLQVLTGALTIDQVQFDARIPVDSTTAIHYQGIFAVPEPSCGMLLTLSGSIVALLGVGARRRRTSRVRQPAPAVSIASDH